MSETTARKPKLTFILSHDYGELSSALYFINGCDFQSTLLMPARLLDLNRGGLPAQALCYQSLADVFDAVDREEPDIIFLFSAYLYAVNNLLRIEETEELVRGLKSRTRAVVTTDPFLGLMVNPNATTIREDHPMRAALTEHFARLSPTLKHLTHLYFMPAEGIPVADRVSFANPTVVVTEPQVPHAEATLARRVGIDRSRKRWLFILSAEDYGFQAGVFGRTAFDGMLLDLLGSAVSAGRQPVLIGPRACIDSLAGRGASIPGLILTPFCGHDVFQSLLLDAEFVFYWNVFSNSVMARVMNRRPVFFFGRGHMAYAMPALYVAGVRHYYLDCELPYLDQRGGLTVERLVQLAAQQETGFESTRSQLNRSPTPDVLVARLKSGT